MKKGKPKSPAKDAKKALPYPCQQVLELYASNSEDADRLENLQKAFKKREIISEMYYTNHAEVSYATLVIFLPWNFHGEISKFSLKAYQTWH